MIEGLGYANIPALIVMALAGLVSAMFLYFRMSTGSRIVGLIFGLIVGISFAVLGIRELSLVPSVWTACAVGIYGLEGYAYLIASSGLIGSLGILVIRDWRSR